MHPSTFIFFRDGTFTDFLFNLSKCRVPPEMKGPLDTHWKIRDTEGYVLNNDGTRSICVHQWDRWYKDLAKFVDSKLYDPPNK